MKAQTFLIIFLVTLASCSVNNWDIKRYQNKFETHQKDFEILVNLLKTQDIKVGYSINENDLPKNIQNIIGDLNISNINLNVTQCKGSVDYEFTSSWSSKATLYFSKDTCNKKQTIKGYHSKTSEMIEVWGLGDGWIMWIDYDFI
jgi:hypothetical protein